MSVTQVNCLQFSSAATLYLQVSYQKSAMCFAELQANLSVFTREERAKSQKSVCSQFYLIDLFN